MTTQTAVQGHVNKGLGIAAKNLGATYNLYRPRTTNTVIANINLIDQISLAYDVDPAFSMIKANTYAHPVYYALVDLTELKIGDYLVEYQPSTDGCRTFYLANMEPLRAGLIIQCNRTATVYRPTPNAVGNGYYSGNDDGYGTALLTNWPCSILLGPKGEKNEAELPGDPRSPWYSVLLPPHEMVQINTADLLIDDLGRRYIMSAIEVTVLGIRATVQYSGT